MGFILLFSYWSCYLCRFQDSLGAFYLLFAYKYCFLLPSGANFMIYTTTEISGNICQFPLHDFSDFFLAQLQTQKHCFLVHFWPPILDNISSSRNLEPLLFHAACLSSSSSNFSNDRLFIQFSSARFLALHNSAAAVFTTHCVTNDLDAI